MIKEYLAQVITIVIIAFLLWRVETLQRLESEEELSVDDTDYSYIGISIPRLQPSHVP